MDGQPPYYNQNNWHPNDQQDNDNMPYLLTNSQTQRIIENLVESPPPYIEDPVATVDNGSFMGHGPDTYNEFPQHQLADQVYHPNSDYVMHEEQSHIPVNTNSSFVSVNEIPATELWPGHLNFTVEFSKAQDKKATPWIFSTKLKKLFVSIDKACPILFRMDNLPQEFHRYCVRGQMVYSIADHFHDHVERCPTHRMKGPALPYASHVLRCEDTTSTYIIDHSDKRHSVVVPLKPPAPGTQSVSLCYKFMCLSSCQGGLNRRPTKLIFTLETLDNQVVGRYACDVRICSCPGRDIRTEEGKLEKNHSTEQTAKESEDPELIPIKLPPISFPKGKMKKRKATPSAAPPVPPPTEPQPPGDQEDDDGIYNFNIDIPGRRNYLFVRDMVTRFLRDYGSRPADSNEHSDHNETVKRFKKEQP